MDTDRPEGMTISASAYLLRTSLFSLMRRVQTGEIQNERARTGEIVIPSEVLQGLMSQENPRELPRIETLNLSDENLGIERARAGVKRNGEYPVQFKVPAFGLKLAESEVESYRKAFSAIGGEMREVTDLATQLKHPELVAPSPEQEVATNRGRWHVRGVLLNLRQSNILLCERGYNQFAIIELFHANGPFTDAKGEVHILHEGNNATELVSDFKNEAHHTLRLIASNAVAKAQKIVWERYAEHRPAQVIAAISERCRLAVAPSQVVAESQDPCFQRVGGIHV
jgi:hypothetical protein